MGIPGLWKILEPTSHSTSLIELSIREGFMINRHGTCTIVVGVDAGPMIYAAQSAIDSEEYSQTERPELRALFFRLSWLSRSGVSAVFVFDGPDRPKYKRNRRVRATPHWLTAKFKDLILGFGFHYHLAPGEAEAELAYLNACQAVDIILATDNDVFLFGAKQVMRSPVDDQHLDNVSVFTADIFQNQHNTLFTVAGFFLMAVLSGGDYDMVGLPNCGPTIASALAAGPLAQSLYDATKSLSQDELRDDFLPTWRNSLQYELANDPYKRLGRKYTRLAKNIPSRFPDPNVLKQYCCPLTSVQVPDYAVAWLHPQVPYTPMLARLSSHLFGWGPDIVDRFISHVWDGYFIRKLIKDASLGIFIPSGQPNLRFPTIDGTQKIGNKSASPSAFHFYQVTFWIPSLISEAATAVLESGGPNTVVHDLANAHSMSVWIPAPVFQTTNHDQIIMFHNNCPQATSPQPSAEYFMVLEELDVLA